MTQSYIFCIYLEANKLVALQSYQGIRMSIDAGVRRPMSTIVELSAEPVYTSRKNSNIDRELLPRMSLTPLAQGDD